MANFEMGQQLTETAVEKLRLEAVLVKPEGLGFGSGSINGTPEGASAEVLQAVDNAIKHNPHILVPIDKDETGAVLDDDGCGDGRGVKTVYKSGNVLKRSLNRAKVFGGSVTMAAATRIGLGRAENTNLATTFTDAMGDLAERHIDFGAHTDEHAEGTNCGCGAIDKAPQVLVNIDTYKQQIVDTALSLGAESKGIDEVMENFAAYTTVHGTKPYSGKAVMDAIIDSGKVVKKLEGGHREARIILNTVEGFTVNQELIRQVSGGMVQVFAVDVWRLQDLAVRLYPSDPEKQQRAFVSELVYTLGVAATLTRGDLPTYLLRNAGVTAQANI